jgi:methylenetetrahydrofolate dehydrogenase (NADP+)/methenyltetrahydrofolate cyclohydrolase
MTDAKIIAKLIDGKAFAAGLRARIGRQVAALAARHGIIPGLAAVLVGDDPASQVYVRSKEKQTAEAGMASVGRRLDAQTSQDALLRVIAELNADPAVHGILVQLPLPDQIETRAIIEAVEPAKDVDGFHPINVGRLVNGDDALVPCTPVGCTMMLKDTLGDLGGLNAVIVGRSTIVGKPMAQLLLAEHCTVTVAHSRTNDLPAVCRGADILVAAVGRAQMIKGDWIKPGATVIDVGINRIEAPEKGSGKTRLVGDVAFDEAVQVAGAITPVPGGVGPMTIACLLQNTLVACCRQNGIPVPDDPGD